MRDENVYIKQDNGKYRAIGLQHIDYIPDGIWYVRHHNHSIGTTNVDHYLSGIFKVGDAKVLDFTRVCGMQDYVDYILDSQEFKDFYEKGYSLYELTSKIIALVFDLNDKYHKEHDDNRRF